MGRSSHFKPIAVHGQLNEVLHRSVPLVGDVLTTIIFIVSSGRRRRRGAPVGDCVRAHVSVSLARKSLFFATLTERNTKRFDARVLSENVAFARLNQARVRILTLDKRLRTISTARIAHVHDKKRTPD